MDRAAVLELEWRGRSARWIRYNPRDLFDLADHQVATHTTTETETHDA